MITLKPYSCNVHNTVMIPYGPVIYCGKVYHVMKIHYIDAFIVSASTTVGTLYIQIVIYYMIRSFLAIIAQILQHTILL